MARPSNELPLPNAPQSASWSYMEPTRDGADPRIVYRTAIEEGPSLAAPKPGQQEEDDEGPRTRKKGLPERLRRLLPLLAHEFTDIDGFDEKDIRYGNERAVALPKIRLKRKRRSGHDVRGRACASYPWLKRIFPRLVSLDEEPENETRKFVFAGYRPSSVHVLGRVLDSAYRFRLEDLASFVTHGDHVLHVLEHVDAGSPCLDLDAILYCPSIDPAFPFKFVVCANSRTDNYVTFVSTLQRVFMATESVDSFLDRAFSQLKLGWERFGPACATPEFQEVELRLWTLLHFAASQLQISVGNIVSSMDGQLIRSTLRKIRSFHDAIDQCLDLPSVLAAFYRSEFNIPFGQLFEHALAAIADIAKSVECDLKGSRPKTIEALTEMVTRFRRLEPRDPLADLELVDARIQAAYAKKPEPQPASPPWVRRYREIIFTGTDKFDQRRYRAMRHPT